MRARDLAIVIGLFGSVGCGPAVPAAVEPVAKPTPKPEPPPPPLASVAERQLKLPDGCGIDDSNLDRTADPCDDFYQFACGGWIKNNPIPGDHSRWGSFSQIDERNLVLLRKYLEADAAGKGDSADAYADKLGGFWTSCMDEAGVEKAAPAALKEELAHVDKVKDIATLEHEVARQHLSYPGSSALFNFNAQQDLKDATLMIAWLDQGGIALPDRDYYIATDKDKVELRTQYEAHVAKMFELAGEKAEKAAADAKTVLRLETALAQASMDRVARRDPTKLDHRLELVGVEAKAPKFPWKAYLKDLKHPTITQINVPPPDFVTAINDLLTKEKIEDWKVYLRWYVIHDTADLLGKAFVDENFHFFDATLNGTKEQAPRWKKCIRHADHLLGEALAQPFIRETFGAEGKATTVAMVGGIEKAMNGDLESLAWMDAATREAAKGKLGAVANMIGYPDKWRKYDGLEIKKDAFVKNVVHGVGFEAEWELARIGKPVDRNEWHMTPPTVNAYYDPSLNEMVFPAGILQPPFYKRGAAAAVNYGAAGMVMGHELTHGFDDEGRRFDSKGNLREWWSPAVGKEFEGRAECVAKQFDGYVAVDDLHVNGHLTLGENIADLGGLKLAFKAWKDSGAAGTPAVSGQFTDEQLFFLGHAQSWCSATRPENARRRVVSDPHSPPQFRVNGPLSNSPEFAKAWQCAPKQKMVRENACVVW